MYLRVGKGKDHEPRNFRDTESRRGIAGLQGLPMAVCSNSMRVSMVLTMAEPFCCSWWSVSVEAGLLLELMAVSRLIKIKNETDPSLTFWRFPAGRASVYPVPFNGCNSFSSSTASPATAEGIGCRWDTEHVEKPRLKFEGAWVHGAGRPDQDQERDRPLAHLQAFLQGGHLRILCYINGCNGLACSPRSMPSLTPPPPSFGGGIWGLVSGTLGLLRRTAPAKMEFVWLLLYQRFACWLFLPVWEVYRVCCSVHRHGPSASSDEGFSYDGSISFCGGSAAK